MVTDPAAHLRELSERFLAGQDFHEFWARFMDFVGDELDHVGFTQPQLNAFDALYERVYMSHAGLTTPDGQRDGLTGEEELRSYLREFRWDSLGGKPV
jgi:hypothetical protein